MLNPVALRNLSGGLWIIGLAFIATLLALYLSSLGWISVDGWMGIGISLFIFASAVRIGHGAVLSNRYPLGEYTDSLNLTGRQGNVEAQYGNPA